MSDAKVIMFPETGGTGIPNNGIDPNLLFALNQNGGFGNGGWMWIVFLFFLYPLMRNNGLFGNNCNDNGNCSGFGPLANMINNNDGRQLLDAAVNRNGAAIDKLSSMFGCGKDTILAAISSLNQAICSINSNIADTKYAMSIGNKDIIQQMASCCCDIRESITQGNYQNQLQTINQTNTLQQAINNIGVNQEKGFCNINYETQKQTCDIHNSIKDLGTQIASQFGDLSKVAMQDKIDSLREANSTLKAQLDNEHQTAIIGQQIAAATTPLANALAGLTREVDAFKCKLPETVSVPNSPGILVPNCVAWNAFGLNPFGFNQNGSIWS